MRHGLRNLAISNKSNVYTITWFERPIVALSPESWMNEFTQYLHYRTR